MCNTIIFLRFFVDEARRTPDVKCTPAHASYSLCQDFTLQYHTTHKRTAPHSLGILKDLLLNVSGSLIVLLRK